MLLYGLALLGLLSLLGCTVGGGLLLWMRWADNRVRRVEVSPLPAAPERGQVVQSMQFYADPLPPEFRKAVESGGSATLDLDDSNG